ncbi:hypothetical protein FO519_005561 [Halicephalobus sp. NKZ332]|nr:hypothetical protein FO519_005561 [Halicephalobus sp. NKZ332]
MKGKRMRMISPIQFEFLLNMAEFPTIDSGISSGASDDLDYPPISKQKRKILSKQIKWRKVDQTPVSEAPDGESGYQSETSPINLIDGDSEANSLPRNYSEVVAGNGKSDDQSPSTSSPRTYSAVVAGAAQRGNGLLRSNSTKGDQDQITKTIPLTTISRMDILGDSICLYYEKVTQAEGTLFRKLRLRDALYYRIAHYFPVCGLYIVGSSLNGFGNDKSDMDLCLMITNQELDQKTDAINVLRTVEYLVSSIPNLQSCQLIEAKVPILRILFKDGLTVDLNANNSVAIRNTHLLCYYAFSDWRVRPLVSIVKEWAKRCNINDASKASFTSYSLVLMVIHFLQCGLENPVLPSLQDKYPEVFDSRVDVRTLNVSVPLDPPVQIGNPDIPLGQLLIGFFRYYAVVYNYERNVISVRLGRLVERSELMSRNRVQWSPICIEEPFTLLNTAHSIFDVNVFNAIRAKFQEAYDILSQTYDIEKLLEVEPYRSPYAFQPSSSQS